MTTTTQLKASHLRRLAESIDHRQPDQRALQIGRAFREAVRHAKHVGALYATVEASECHMIYTAQDGSYNILPYERSIGGAPNHTTVGLTEVTPLKKNYLVKRGYKQHAHHAFHFTKSL